MDEHKANVRVGVSRRDARMRSDNRKILLLLDNVSSHHAHETLTHVEIRKLPTNTTAHLQPLDAGVIRNFKSIISKKKALYYADRLDEILSRFGEDGQETLERVLEAIGNVDVFVAMRWAQAAWASVTCTTITYCWRHTEILDEELYELIEGVAKLCV
uniref:PREDICTED: similar to Tigger transposable elementderived protein 6 putative n=1 Tax=Albugo laibachii Nc14 TaxID=890382 RepID=F0WF92_9STRA|nr:PREDICTED: similar to Tigger transposable elementderived protein 6 putative [Albugo laibachii Nc14]|eukprot:CCA19874.1 PREDICTED: similar to Tigger transposable elementderived protein 6 putative [Albugo laibachii Nc14]